MNLKVSELVTYLKKLVDNDSFLQNIVVEGEISNFSASKNGHFYFDLKEAKYGIKCVMFRNYALNIKQEFKNGDKVVILADTSIYTESGTLQLYVKKMKLAGVGDLYQQYELLKNKLNQEGLFNSEHKKEAPNYPLNIAVVVGDNSAAMSDIKKTFLRRWPLAKVDYYPSLVQGESASKDIINNLLKIDELNYEAIILARGGGSFEDLFCFNDEDLARTIYNLKTFIITGIGHEQDFTIADFVADVRASTPTAAVEMLVPDIKELVIKVDINSDRLTSAINKKLALKGNKLESLLNSHYFKDPQNIIKTAELKLNNLLTKIYNSTKKIELISNGIDDNVKTMSNSLNHRLIYEKNELLKQRQLLEILSNTKVKESKTRLAKNTSILNAYSHKNTLKRGYALVYKDNKLLSSIKDISLNDKISIELNEGKLLSEVKEKING